MSYYGFARFDAPVSSFRTRTINGDAGQHIQVAYDACSRHGENASAACFSGSVMSPVGP
jgi:hypothetical protein